MIIRYYYYYYKAGSESGRELAVGLLLINFITAEQQALLQAATVQCIQELLTQCLHHYRCLTVTVHCQLPQVYEYCKNPSTVHNTFHRLLTTTSLRQLNFRALPEDNTSSSAPRSCISTKSTICNRHPATLRYRFSSQWNKLFSKNVQKCQPISTLSTSKRCKIDCS